MKCVAAMLVVLLAACAQESAPVQQQQTGTDREATKEEITAAFVGRTPAPHS